MNVDFDYIPTETDVSSPKLKVVTRISKWNHYSIADDTINNKTIKFIVGSDDIDSRLFTMKDVGSTVLYELLYLYKFIPENCFSSNVQYINDNLPTDTKHIFYSKAINFCKKYGMPFWCDNLTTNTSFQLMKPNPYIDRTKEAMLHDITPYANTNRFPIASFIFAIFYLHRDFVFVARKNNWIDDINVQPFLCDNDDKTLLFDLSPYMTNHPYLTYWNRETSTLQLETDNIIHLSMYFLSLLYQSKSFSNTGYIRICKKCNQLFITDNPRKRYCENPCTRQAYYSKRKGESK